MQHALALVVPGARYAAMDEAGQGPPGAAPSLLVAPGRDVVAREAARAAPARYLLGAAPTAAASLVIALPVTQVGVRGSPNPNPNPKPKPNPNPNPMPVTQRAAYRAALDRLKRR